MYHGSLTTVVMVVLYACSLVQIWNSVIYLSSKLHEEVFLLIHNLWIYVQKQLMTEICYDFISKNMFE